LGIKFFSARGHPGGAASPNVILGPPNISEISETTRARKLKLKMLLDMVKYSPWLQKNVSARGRTGGTGPLA